jgi:hypothetical protein
MKSTSSWRRSLLMSQILVNILSSSPSGGIPVNSLSYHGRCLDTCIAQSLVTMVPRVLKPLPHAALLMAQLLPLQTLVSRPG